MNKGKIIQIMGPVVDVAFPDELPAIKEALEVQLDGKRLVMEVSQHIGNNCVRCIMLATSDGLCKDMEVVATGSSISVPVGQKTLGRLFNVVGDTLDGLEDLSGEHNGIGLPAKVRIIFVSSLQCGEMNFTCMRNSAALIAAKAGLRLPHTVLRRYLPTRCRLHIRLPLRRETVLSNGHAARCLYL